MSKSIQIMAIAVAFVAVTLISGVVYADEKNGKPFEAIWVAIHDLESTPTNGITNVYNLTTIQAIDNTSSQINEVRASCVQGDTVLGGGVGSLEGIVIIANKPFKDTTTDPTTNGWLGIFKTTSGQLKVVTVDVICAATP